MSGRRTGAPSPQVDALQAALATEHAAIFVYGALGAQTSATARPALHDDLVAAYRVHQSRRDQLTTRLHDLGATPVAAEPGYRLPADLGSAEAVMRRARALEQAAAASYAHVVASTVQSTRRWAVDALVDAAVRVLAFGGRPEQLPGLAD
ncbi:DUF4439 domain-containing protein [Nocardioides caeni]|uniref:DUF4439 domain-containing protein n=1 Tax=Nocardioides caeni TaxID=574700 RepID=A0A4S8NNG0_9ACTN|nr:DUF4439 domain-containing protein [Nocardioides caeni]THV18460.1 DUF4439 domain-containing protein [Nocardioides caeni]